jgi:GT2 family glycosyltransferase/glycosyltransferase involved in cell wall biosynthesis
VNWRSLADTSGQAPTTGDEPIDSLAAQLEAFRLRREAEAQAAWEYGHAAFIAGDLTTAARWLDRAARFSPTDMTIRLVLGMVKLRSARPNGRLSGRLDAEALFRAVLAKHDVRAAWIGLASALMTAGDAVAAAAALQPALSRHAGTIEPALAALADDVVRAIDTPGWCALEPGGALVTSVAHPRVVLDGHAVSLRFGQALPAKWRRADVLEVFDAGRALLGSPIALDRLRAIEGVVGYAPDGQDRCASGWAWHPANPEAAPVLRLGRRLILASQPLQTVPAGLAPLARPRQFFIPLPAHGQLKVCDVDGRHLLGSPLPGAWDELPPAKPPPRISKVRPDVVTVLVPVYGSPAKTLACLATVFRGLPPWARVLVVDDASPQVELAAELDRLAARRRIRLVRNAINRGFPASVNAGLAVVQGDVVLLNSDTLVPPGWLQRLREAAWSASAIGTVTPLSNDATIVSYPAVAGGNMVPDLLETERLDRLAASANGQAVATIPTAVGFCMYIRRDCLKAVGPLRADVFAQGYGEENDFCMRARAAGWRHVAALGVFVGHVGSASFGGARAHLLARNMEVLNRLHPAYAGLVTRHIEADPLGPARRRMDHAGWPVRAQPAVLLITHDMGGGVQRQVEARIDALVHEGFRPVVLRPVLNHPGWCRIDDGRDRRFINLKFRLPQEAAALTRFVRAQAPVRAEVHHLVGHAPGFVDFCRALKLPYTVYVHDYAWFCARISLIGPERRYCGEPDLAGCDACIAKAGRNLEEEITPADLLARSARDLAGAAQVIAPSADAASRMRRHFPDLAVAVVPWEAAISSPQPPPSRPAPTRRSVCVVGAIGVEKGFDILLACAEDAARRDLNLEFVVVGYTIDDAKLHATGRVFVTGQYEATELPELIVQQDADIAFLPSLWPETWCFALSEMWRAGLDVVAFDIGAPAERVRARGRGRLLPLGLSASTINDVLQTA